MPSFFWRSSCLIAKEGEGKFPYLDFLVNLDGLGMLEIAILETRFASTRSQTDLEWMHMFVWFEFQRRCIILLTNILSILTGEITSCHTQKDRYDIGIKALILFQDATIGRLPLPGSSSYDFGLDHKPTSKTWLEKIPDFKQRLFLPMYSLLMHHIEDLCIKRENMARKDPRFQV